MDPLDPILRSPPPQAQAPKDPMQEVYPNGSVGWAVQTNEDGTRALICHVALPRKVMVFPMDTVTAAALGNKLAAPSVQLPNGHPGS